MQRTKLEYPEDSLNPPEEIQHSNVVTFCDSFMNLHADIMTTPFIHEDKGKLFNVIPPDYEKKRKAVIAAATTELKVENNENTQSKEVISIDQLAESVPDEIQQQSNAIEVPPPPAE